MASNYGYGHSGGSADDYYNSEEYRIWYERHHGSNQQARHYSEYGAAGPSGYYNNYYTPDEATQQSVYTPEGAQSFREANAHAMSAAKDKNKGQARTTVLRRGGGELWEDKSLLEWDPKHFRLFVGDLGNDVSDELLEKKFSTGFPSFVKARVVRDKHTSKTKGYGFVAYSDPEDFLRAWKEINNTYVGSRPVKISKASTQVSAVDIGKRKARQLDSQKKKTGGFGKAPGAGVMPGHGGHKPYVRR